MRGSSAVCNLESLRWLPFRNVVLYRLCDLLLQLLKLIDLKDK